MYTYIYTYIHIYISIYKLYTYVYDVQLSICLENPRHGCNHWHDCARPLWTFRGLLVPFHAPWYRKHLHLTGSCCKTCLCNANTTFVHFAQGLRIVFQRTQESLRRSLAMLDSVRGMLLRDLKFSDVPCTIEAQKGRQMAQVCSSYQKQS